MMSGAALDDMWTRLSSAGGVQRQFCSVRAPSVGGLNVHAAVRTADGARCLLFDLQHPAEADITFEAGGLRLSRVALDEGIGFALILEDSARSDLFTTVCMDLLAFADTPDPLRALRLVMERLEAWRQFLRSLSGSMTRQDAVGLFGELIILEALLSRDAALLPSWRAPADGLHDFERHGYALEVKTSLGPGWRVSISTLDQLDAAGLDRLDLLHVRLFETPDGSTLDELISRIDALLGDGRERRAFSNALLQRGLSPDDRGARSGFRAALQQLTSYAVEDDFPRVRRSDLAGAIVELHYVLDLAQLQSFAGPAAMTLGSFGERCG